MMFCQLCICRIKILKKKLRPAVWAFPRSRLMNRDVYLRVTTPKRHTRHWARKRQIVYRHFVAIFHIWLYEVGTLMRLRIRHTYLLLVSLYRGQPFGVCVFATLNLVKESRL